MNVYEYVFSNPVNWIDPLGLSAVPMGEPPVPVPNGGEGNGWKWNPNPQDSRHGKWGPKKPIPNQSQPMASWEPPDPYKPGSQGHWDVDDGLGNRDRYDMNGNPLTPEEAHGKKPKDNPQVPGPFPNKPNIGIVPPILLPIVCGLMPWLSICEESQVCPMAFLPDSLKNKKKHTKEFFVVYRFYKRLRFLDPTEGRLYASNNKSRI